MTPLLVALTFHLNPIRMHISRSFQIKDECDLSIDDGESSTPRNEAMWKQ